MMKRANNYKPRLQQLRIKRDQYQKIESEAESDHRCSEPNYNKRLRKRQESLSKFSTQRNALFTISR